MRFCAQPGCPNKVERGRCPAHTKQQATVYSRFKTGNTRYDTARWITLRDRFRAEHPFCKNADGPDTRCTQTTDVVDHIIPHRGYERLFFDETNLCGLCYHCHGVKTAKETLA